MIKVGTKRIDNQKGKYSYDDLIYDKNGYADATKYLPLDYDLSTIYCENMKKPISGWSIGENWEGARYNGEKVLKWKRLKTVENIGQN